MALMLKKIKQKFSSSKPSGDDKDQSSDDDNRTYEDDGVQYRKTRDKKKSKNVTVNQVIVQENKGHISQGNTIVTVYHGQSRIEDRSRRNTVMSNNAASSSLSSDEHLPEQPFTRKKRNEALEEIRSSTLEMSRDNKYHVADNIGKQWPKLARMLPDANFTNGQLQNLKDSAVNKTELVYDILVKWEQVAPESATLGNLAKTLDRMNLRSLADGLKLE